MGMLRSLRWLLRLRKVIQEGEGMIRIITDSAADLEPWEYEKLGVICIPLGVSFGDKNYLENTDLTKDMFYRLLEQSEEFPHTSQPSPSSLISAYENAKEEGDDTIVITLSSALSGTYQSTVMAKGLAGYENCYVIDSLNATGGQRLLVEHAAKLRREGKNAQEIVSELETLRSKIVLYACMDTMEYLYRGGRISNTVYKVGSFAHIKPIIRVGKDGRVEVPSKVMGMRKGMVYLCERLSQQQPDEHFPLYVMYTDNRENGELLAGRIRALGYSVPDEQIINVGAAIGTHIGPNACGIVYIAK